MTDSVSTPPVRPPLTPEIEALDDDPDLTVGGELYPPAKPPDLRGKSDEEIVDLMKAWFFDNFEDPAHSTPWDEGEYVYIWGGPYNAEEELEDAFGDTATREAMEEAVSDIEHDGYEWAPSSSRLGPEEPSDEVVRAKIQLYGALQRWDEDRVADLLAGKPGADFATAKLTVRVSDVATLLRELGELGRRARSRAA
jgi:hypothetical protein